MFEPRYDVMSGGYHIKVNVPKEEAWQAAREATLGQTVMVQGRPMPKLAIIYRSNVTNPVDAVAMFEDGEEVPVPRGCC